MMVSQASWVEMVKYAKEVATTEKKLSVEERNILSVAFKNVVGMKRNSRRLLHTTEKKESSKDSSTLLAHFRFAQCGSH